MTKRIEARTKTQQNARALAVSYSAFNKAYDDVPSIYNERSEEKLNAIRVWGRSLLDAQKTLGFELYRTALIEDAVKRAQERSDRLQTQKEAA